MSNRRYAAERSMTMISLLIGIVLVVIGFKLQKERADFQSPNTVFYTGIALMCLGADSIIFQILKHQ